MPIVDEIDYYQQVDLPIFEREFADWLPAHVFDIHAHTWLPEHVLQPIATERVGLVFEAQSVSWAELNEAYALLFPDKTVSVLAFGMPLTVIDRVANNRYVAAHTDQRTSFGLLVPGLDDSAASLWEEVVAGGFVGFKPYLAYVTQKPLEAIRIVDFLRPAALEVANAHGLLVMLHVPRSARIADPENLEDLAWIAAAYPRAKIILAHAGRAYAREIIEPALDTLAEFPNLFFELSNVHAVEVVQAILERVALERIMYGSDIPVATVRGVLLMLNGQRLCLTRKPFPWSLSTREGGGLRCTFMGYEQLRATKRATAALGFTESQVRALFYDNAARLVGGAYRAVAAFKGPHG